MTFNYPFLLLALLLLLLPRTWLRFGGKVIPMSRPQRPHRDSREMGDESIKIWHEFGNPRNWVDLLRGLAGGYALMLGAVELSPEMAKSALHPVFYGQAAFLLLAVLIQTIRIERRFSLVAPLFFIMGLTFSLCGWMGASFALILIWVLNLGLPSAGLFLLVYASLQFAFGYFLGGTPLWVVLSASLTVLPGFLSAVTKRRLVQFNKKTKHA